MGPVNKNLQGIYKLIESKVEKSDYEVFGNKSESIYLQFEITNIIEDRISLNYIKYLLNEEKGERTGRMIDLKNIKTNSLQILLDSPISLKISEYDSTEIPIDWFYIDLNTKSLNYISKPSKQILGTRKKLKKF